VKEPYQRECSHARDDCASRAYGGNLEFLWHWASVCREAGSGCGAHTILIAKQLRGDDEVAKLLQKSLIILAPKPRVNRLLCLLLAVRRAIWTDVLTHRACGVYARNGAMTAMYPQRLWEPIPYPAL